VNRALALALLAPPLLAASGAPESPGAGARPNIVFAFSDEHRWQSMGFTESPELKTPALDRLAKEGASFKTCISNNPLCVPARTMIMTGRWPYATRALENNGALLEPDRQPTLGRLFGAAGYRTCYIGKWHIGMRPEQAGFGRTLVWENTNHHWKSFYRDGEGKTVHYDGYNAVGMTDQALAFIGESAKSGQPFFVMVEWNPPHATFTDPPDDAKALYPKEALRLRPSYQGKAKNQASDLDSYQGYCGHITAIDRELGRLLRRLDELKLAENTIVIYTSDHGSMFGEHGKSSKRHPEEESVRIPFLARWPGRIPAGAQPGQLFGTIDIFPTLCGLAGLPAPATCGGADFAPALFGQPMKGPDSQFIMHISNKKEFDKVADDPKARVFRPFFRGVRTPRYTYAVGVRGPWVLFDNEKDPYQLKNLVEDSAYASAREGCQAQLDAWLEKAEYGQMPADLRSKLLPMSLPDRIAWQNV
jgi:arylsulfatase A-like enzyme